GNMASRDIDCDATNHRSGRCSNDGSGQSQTAFKGTVQGYNKGISDLDATIHPYVVLGNSGSSPSWDPTSIGIRPLSVVALDCFRTFGPLGDTNGGTVTGEASLALADLCCPSCGFTGNNGWGDHDILFIAFPGAQAVPGANGANWATTNKQTFEDSIKALGDSLIASL
ncbi:glycoside hydrolase family 75 protein, partial [Atractiella rhizophila]